MFSKKTKWICASERFVNSQDAAGGSGDALCMLARRQMKLPKRIKRAFLTISADDRYVLYINGRFVSCGPAACYPQEQYCERLDVTKYLKFGHNIFAVQVHYDGKDSPSRVSGDNRQGFITELELDGGTLPVTNEHVRVLCPSGASYIRENGVTAEWIDLRSFPAGWTQLKFDDSAWIKPRIKKNHGYNFVKQPVLPGEYVEFEVTDAGDGVYDLEDGYTGTLCVQAHGIDGSTLSFYREDDGSLLYKLTLNGSSTADFSLPRRLRRIKVVPEGGAEISHLTVRVLRLGENENALSLKTVTPALVEMDNRWKSALLDDVNASFDLPDEKTDEGVLALAKSYMSGETGHLAMLLKNISLSQASVKTLLAGRPSSRCREDREASLKFARHVLSLYEQTGESELINALLETAYGVIRAFSTYARRDGLLESTDESGEKVCLSRLNALYIGALISYEKLCGALKVECGVHSAPAIEAFNKAFLNENTCLYDDIQGKDGASPRGNLYPVYFGFASDETLKAAAALFKAPMERTDEYYRLKALSECGLAGEEYAQIVGGTLNAPEAEICAFIEDILSLNPDVINGSVWKHRLPDDAGSLSARVQAFGHRALFTRHGDFVTLKF